jgi:toxin-antitoxin system PIN domain toxin
MMVPDVNVLIGAFREDSIDHIRHQKWLQDLIDGPEPFGSIDHVLSSFIRIVTNRRIFADANLPSEALEFAESIRGAPNCVVIHSGPRHWEIFADLCLKTGARGDLVPDAYLAALAIESGSEWITMDGDYARFPGLRWRRPF